MYQRSTFTLSVLFLMAALPAHATFTCPPMPTAVTSVNRDIKSEISASVGSLGKIKAGEIAAKTETEAKNLFGKYPNVDKLLALQMMAATYCEMLRGTTAIKEIDKINRWEKFFEKYLNLKSNPQVSTKHPHTSQDSRPGSTSKSAPNTMLNGHWIISHMFDGKSYPHDMYITRLDNGTIAGKGGYPAGGQPYNVEWVITGGSVDENRIVLTVEYTVGARGTIMHMAGDIAQNGSAIKNGTWDDNAGGKTRMGTWRALKQ